MKINVKDIRPITSHRYHLPPSVHTTFLGTHFVVCTFLPRPFEEDEDAMRVPFFHRNIDYDEVIFYSDGEFFSRDGIGAGMVTWHPTGIHHGPHPKAIPLSRKKIVPMKSPLWSMPFITYTLHLQLQLLKLLTIGRLGNRTIELLLSLEEVLNAEVFLLISRCRRKSNTKHHPGDDIARLQRYVAPALPYLARHLRATASPQRMAYDPNWPSDLDRWQLKSRFLQ